MVILEHTVSAGLDTLASEAAAGLPARFPASVTFGMDLFKSLLLCCNSLFLMISGALILNGRSAEEPVSFYRKRLRRVLLPCFLYFCFYEFYAFGAGVFRPSGWLPLLRHFFANDSGLTPHFWLDFVIIT